MPKQPRLKAAERKKIHNDLHPFTKEYHNSIPLYPVIDVLKKHGLILLQEDNTELSCLLCGMESHTTFAIGRLESFNEETKMYEPLRDMLYFYWYKREETGRYEINMYLT